MSIVGEVRDGVEALSDMIARTRSIIDAVSDGRKYLSELAPDVEVDFSTLIAEMQITVEGLREATSVIATFQFIAGSERRLEDDLAELRDALDDRSRQIGVLRGRIRSLKGSCERVGELQDKLDRRASERLGVLSMFSLVSRQSQRVRDELANDLHEYYGYDKKTIEFIESFLHLSERMVHEVRKTLGAPGPWRPDRVPDAADQIATYAILINEPRDQLLDLVDLMAATQEQLGRSY